MGAGYSLSKLRKRKLYSENITPATGEEETWSECIERSQEGLLNYEGG